MSVSRNAFLLLFLSYPIFPCYTFSTDSIDKPVTPHASPEARALLQVLHTISGQYTFTGQHNYPNVRDRNTQFAARYIGKTPIVYSTDWGFAEMEDKDSYLARPDIVEEVKRQHRLGSLITICWHAVPPTANEPVTFQPSSDNIPPDSLASVQGQLLDQQFKDILTPGTQLYHQWCAQVDTIAVYLRKLQEAHIPILWRPYHEMNGNWFWWGGRQGKYGTAVLYRQLFDRFVHHHKLNNLIWMWSVDRPVKPEMKFEEYFPGIDCIDILTLDVYGNDFQQSYYESLVLLSQGKPIALAEVGNPPSLEILTMQPKWTFYVTWSGMVRNTLKKQYTELMSTRRVLNLEDSLYWKTIAPYRSACDLPTTPPNDKLTVTDFSGEWLINEEQTQTGTMGLGNLPYKLKIVQKENLLTIQKIFIVEYADDRITIDSIKLDGSESISEMWNSPMIMRATWIEPKGTLKIESKILFNRGGQSSEMTIQETWNLKDRGSVLTIQQSANTFWGPRKAFLIFDKI